MGGVSSQDELLRAGFVAALERGDADAAHHLAGLLSEPGDVERVYDAVRECLHALSTSPSATRRTLTVRIATNTALSVCERLRARRFVPSYDGRVVLAVPTGDRHTLALHALAHLLEEAGWGVLVVEDLPAAALAELVATGDVVAVVVSGHERLPVGEARSQLARLREAAPHVLLVAGGPAFEGLTAPGVELVTSDVQVLLTALHEHASGLTTREREVLSAVAEGLTTAEIASLLRVSPSTVKTHMDNIFVKTKSEHRAAAVARAMRLGWFR